jgi:HlyD family secretion protein
VALASARKALDEAVRLESFAPSGITPRQETIDAAEEALAQAEEHLDRAQADFDRLAGLPEDDSRRAAALAALEAARQERDSAQAIFDWFSGEAAEIDPAILSARVTLAEAQLNEAQRQYDVLSAGPDPDLQAQAEARLRLAQAGLAAARAQVRVETETIDLQIEKLLVRAPLGGVILSRNIEPGEVLVAGAQAMSIGQLSHLTVTVYLPEDRYGLVDLGDHVQVRVDAFPDEVFDAVVTRVADRAEFTPRNVQTQEGRRTTVFALELTVADPAGLLKPGMPADVTFEAE